MLKCPGNEIAWRAFACAFFRDESARQGLPAESSYFSHPPPCIPPPRISHSSTPLLTSSHHRPLLCSDGMPSTSQSPQKQAILVSTTGRSFPVCLHCSTLLHASHRLLTGSRRPDICPHSIIQFCTFYSCSLAFPLYFVRHMHGIEPPTKCLKRLPRAPSLSPNWRLQCTEIQYTIEDELSNLSYMQALFNVEFFYLFLRLQFVVLRRFQSTQRS